MSPSRAFLIRRLGIAALTLLSLAAPAAASPTDGGCSQLADLLQNCHKTSVFTTCSDVQRTFREALEFQLEPRMADFTSRLCERTCELKKKGMTWDETRDALVSACVSLVSR